MAIDRITQKIMEDADTEIRHILAEAEGKIAAVRAENEKGLAEIEEETREDAAREAEEQKRRMISRAQAEMRKELLAEKQGLIEEAFQKALRSFVELDEEKYSALMKKLLLENVEEGDEEIIVAARDKGVDWHALVSDVNRELSTGKRKGGLTLSHETRDMMGGFVLRKGRKEINGDLKLLVKSMREELEFEVAQILWGNRPPDGKST